MNRNVESHFALNPTRIDMSRSTFDRSASVKTSFNVGDIVPFFLEEVLPGDTFDVRTSKVVRMQTLLTPMMDNVYLDSYYFFVPNRLVWKHWKEFNGENTESAWLPTTQYSVPQITSPASGWSVGTVADYFGLPTGIENLSVSALPFQRFYASRKSSFFNCQTVRLNKICLQRFIISINHSSMLTLCFNLCHLIRVINIKKPIIIPRRSKL